MVANRQLTRRDTPWNSILGNADLAALEPLRAAGVTPTPASDALFKQFYESLAQSLGDGSLTVGFDELFAGYVRGKHQIDLNTEVKSTPLADWLALVHGEFWHEFAHSQYSREFDPDETLDIALDDAFEDIRAERRLLEEHPQARPWLRANALGRNHTYDHVLNHLPFQGNGWVVTSTIFIGRGYAGVVDADEQARVRRLIDRHRLPLVEELEDLWQRYASLDDDRLSTQVEAKAIIRRAVELKSAEAKLPPARVQF